MDWYKQIIGVLMKKLLFGIVTLSSLSFAMQRLDQRTLPANFLQNVMVAESALGNFHFYSDLKRRSEGTTSAQQLFELCTKYARWDDWACEKQEEIRPDNCTLIGQAQRHLHCWWQHKQAILEVIQQK